MKIPLVIVMEKMSNKAKGQAFEERAKMILEQRLGGVLESEVKLNDHKFDLVSSDRSIIIECKSLEWTASGNIPSAKLDNLDKAVNFLAKESEAPRKILCMSRSTCSQKNESLAEYFVRTSKFLPHTNVSIYEIDDKGNVKEIKR